MKLINADKVIEKLKEHKSLFCKNRDEFRALSDKDKARVDEIDTCIAELVNAEEVQTTDTDSDTISRVKAIEALTEYGNGRAVFISVGEAVIRIEQLPSAQPDIIRCKDCKHWVPGYITDNDDFIPPKCGEWQQMVGHSSDDYCSLAERREVTT